MNLFDLILFIDTTTLMFVLGFIVVWTIAGFLTHEPDKKSDDAK